MREVLFRGRDINGKWAYGDLLHIPDGCLIFASNPTSGTTSNEEIAVALLPEEITVVYPKTVGQFTGLTDKNGVRVFEGDILRVDNKYNSQVIGGVRGYCYDCANTTLYHIAKYHECEVIGNIHDNPELLGEVK